MPPRWITATLLVLVVAAITLASQVEATHPFSDPLARYSAKVANNRAGVASDLRLHLRFSSPSTLPALFGGIAHHVPPAWGIATDEDVPNGDNVGVLEIALHNPLILASDACPAAPAPALLLKVMLFDASSDSSEADYPDFLPPGEHKARWAGSTSYGSAKIPVNVLVDKRPDIAPGNLMRIFVGTGGLTGLPMIDDPALADCFLLDVGLRVAGKSDSGAHVATNPSLPGIYKFTAILTSWPDPTDLHDHRITLSSKVAIKKADAKYHVDVRDHNPDVATDLIMALRFRDKDQLPRPFGGVTHYAPEAWRIAGDEDVPDGDGVAHLRLRLSVPTDLANVCADVLPEHPSLRLSIPLRDASSDSSATSYPPFLPAGDHQARWTGAIGRLDHRIPVNVLVDETDAGATAMRIFIGRGHLNLHPLAECLSLDVILQVAGHSRTGIPVAVNPAEEGVYSFLAQVLAWPKLSTEPNALKLKASVVIEASPSPKPCDGCPPDDEDSDTVKDETDACPAEPEDIDAHDMADGCPDSGDDDADGLLNLVELLVGTDAANQDTDGDGCTDGNEVGEDERLGGLRNPLIPWDFYDVPGLGGAPPDGEIDLFNDILGVILHYSLDGSPPYDERFDRGPSAGPNSWNMTAPDGSIDLFIDVLGVIKQYGHDCT